MADVTIGAMWTPASRAWLCAQLGWRVIPLVAKTKIPAIKDWPSKATTDIDTIDEWFNWTKTGCDVGIVTGPESGIFVIDIDVHWCNGFIAVKSLWNRHGERKIPNTFRVKTPSGGEQWYFRYPDDGKVRNVSSKISSHGPLGAGLDVRGWHGQVVAPLAVGREVINDTTPMMPPNWLIDLVTREPQHSSAVITVDSSVSAIALLEKMAIRLAGESSGRNDTLNTFSFKLGILGGRGLLSENDARTALHEACVRNGAIDEWRNGEGQFEATFISGWSAGVVKGAQGE